MNILKKIFTLLLIVSLSTQVPIHSFANSSEYSIKEQIILAELPIVNEIKNGQKIIDKIDMFIGNVSNRQASILKSKILKIQDSLIHKDSMLSTRETKTLLIISYLLLKIEEKFLDQKNETKKDLLKEYAQTLDSTENKKVNAQLVKIQKNILQSTTSHFEKIIGELETYMNYEEKGDFKAKVDINHGLIGKIKAELQLNDYTISSSNFDSQIKTKLQAIIDATPNGSEAIKLEIAGFLDFILKDQNYYILLKDLKITDEQGVEQIKAFLEKAKDIAAKNKYIHFEDKNSAQMMEIIKTITPQNILTQGDKILSQPLFRAYKKEGNKYYLIPTKYACDTAKELTNKFDPFNGKKCTDGQYQDLLEDIAKTKAEFYIELGTHTTLGFEANNIDNEIETFIGHVTFSETDIEEIYTSIVPNQERNPDEGAQLEYKRNSEIEAYLYADKGEIDMQLSSKLDRNNNFSFIDLNIDAHEFSGNLYLNNHTLSGKYEMEEYSTKIVGLISGKTNSQNELSKLKISNQIINLSKYSAFENLTVFDYSSGAFNLSNNYSSESTLSDILFLGEWNTTTNTVSSAIIDINVKQKDFEYDPHTYNKIYSGDFKKTFESKLELKNENISGQTTLLQDSEKVLNITHSGKYKKQYFELNNIFSTSLYNFITGGESDISGNVNLKINTQNNHNDAHIYISVDTNTEKIFELELDNTSIKTYKNIDIQSPNKGNIIPLEEIIGNPYQY